MIGYRYSPCRKRHQALFSDVIEVGSPNLIIDDLFIGRYHGIDIGYGSVYVGAMATDVAHILYTASGNYLNVNHPNIEVISVTPERRVIQLSASYDGCADIVSARVFFRYRIPGSPRATLG